MDKPSQTALCPWFGSNRTLAANVGAALVGCRWVGVAFAGGMCELAHIQASTVMVNDLHAHILNLAAVVADPTLNVRLRATLDYVPCHPDVLSAAQRRCEEREAAAGDNWFGGSSEVSAPDLDWAVDYFVCAWMSRNGNAGTKSEFSAPQSVRWDAGGGDSATRFRNATASLADWQAIMRRCNFVRMDALRFLEAVKDEEGHGIYADPPFPSVGDGYKYSFDARDQERLAAKLASFKKCRVVVRFYRHPLIERLYPEALWTWSSFEGRKQTNEVASEEVLLTRNLKESA